MRRSDPSGTAAMDDLPAVRVRLSEVLADRGMTVAQLSDLVGITEANLFVLKSNRARAVRLSTLSALCHALQCTPGDLLELEPRDGTAGRPSVGPAEATPYVRSHTINDDE